MSVQNKSEYNLILPLRYSTYSIEDTALLNGVSGDKKGIHEVAYYDGTKPTISRRKVIELTETIELPAQNVALVLVDFWGTGTQKDLLNVDTTQRKIGELLSNCRKHGVTIIHAPNKPGVDCHEQYHQLREKVRKIMQEYPLQSRPDFMAWPPYDHPLSRHLRAVRARDWPGVLPQQIHFLARPLEDEYVAYTHEELRFVLCKKESYFLLYAGYGLNNCILNRPTGINALAGTDTVHEETYSFFHRVPISIGIVKDCTLAGAIPGYSSEESKTSILEHLKVRLAYEVDSGEITFNKRLTSQGSITTGRKEGK